MANSFRKVYNFITDTPKEFSLMQKFERPLTPLRGHFVIRFSPPFFIHSLPSRKGKRNVRQFPSSLSSISLPVRAHLPLLEIRTSFFHSLVSCVKVKNCRVTARTKSERGSFAWILIPSRRRSRKLPGRQSLAGSWIATVN